MKAVRYLILFLFAFLADTVFARGGEEDRDKALQDSISCWIEQRTFAIDARIAYPQGGRSIPLTSPYGLRMQNDSVDVFLPYYGRAYTIPYGGGEGLRFQAPVRNYKQQFKKDSYRISFEVRTREDNYRFSLSVYTGGSATIQVTMQNRQSIRFTGEIDATGLQ